jgi:hypothetical protein
MVWSVKPADEKSHLFFLFIYLSSQIGLPITLFFRKNSFG